MIYNDWCAIKANQMIFLIKQNRIFLSYGSVNTTVWMHHIDANKIYEEKARWELHKNTIGCFEQILEATPYKAAAVWLLTSHPTTQVRWVRHAEYCSRSKYKLRSDILLWTPTHGHTSLGQRIILALCSHWI